MVGTRCRLGGERVGVGSLVAAPLGGILCDRVGTRRVLIAALFFSGLILAIYPLFSNRALVFALTFLSALTADAFRPASYTFISQVTAPSQHARRSRRCAAALLLRLDGRRREGVPSMA